MKYLLLLLALSLAACRDDAPPARVISPQTTPHLYYYSRDADTGAVRYHLNPDAVKAEADYSFEVRGNLY